MSSTLGPRHAESSARRSVPAFGCADAAALAAALAGPEGEALTAYVWCLRQRRAAPPPSSAVVALATELGLVRVPTAAAATLTPHGALVADALGEYAFWLVRGRTHHGAHEIPALAAQRLDGRDVLEVGCGAGVNLLALQDAACVVGIDVDVHHLHMTEVLARVEERTAPRRVCARAEALPFGSETFDVVLFLGSLPYMHVARALDEAARVLRPGGRAIVVQSDIGQFARIRLGRLSLRRFAARTWLRELRAVVGTAVEPLVGRLLIGAHAATHVSIGRMSSRLRRAGLVPVAGECRRHGAEACHVATKPDPATHSRAAASPTRSPTTHDAPCN